MKKLTSNNYRKIVGLILVGITVILLVIPAIMPLDYTGKSLWQSVFSSEVESAQRVSIIILAVLQLLSVIFVCLTIPSLLRKGKRTHYIIQAVTSILIVALLVFNFMASNFFNLGQVVLIIAALLVNLVSSAYYLMCIVFNYDEMYFVPEVVYEDEIDEDKKDEVEEVR